MHTDHQQQGLASSPLQSLFRGDACLGGGFKYFYFHPYLGKIPILTNIFQMGRNHQPVVLWGVNALKNLKT